VARLGHPPVVPVPQVFADWCQERNLLSVPASADTVALFVIQNLSRQPAELSTILAGISAGHAHTADPTTSWAVNRALELAHGVTKLPRSWPKAEAWLFDRLPYFVRVYLARRSQMDDAAVRRAQNAAADQRKLKEKSNAENKTTDNARPEVGVASTG
jgi:hypothetical protein